MDFLIIDMLKVSLLFWIFVYGLFNITSGLFSSCLPVSLCLIAAFPILLNFIRIKPPSKAAVEAVLGKDPAFINDEDNDKGYVMRTVAHRGAGLDAPENSLISFKMCAEKGCDAIEFDVMLTADDVPILFHDNTLERLTDSPKEVRLMTWDELSTVDLSVKHPLREKFANTRIPKLEDVVVQCIAANQRMFIDIKDCDTKIVPVLLDFYQRHPELHKLAVCSSFFPNIIYRIRKANPQIVCSLAYRPYFFSYECFSCLQGTTKPRSSFALIRLGQTTIDKAYTWVFHRVIYYLLGISAVLLQKDAISGEVLYDWRCKGIRVLAWTVNHPIEKQHYARNFKLTYLTDTLIGESSAHSETAKPSTSAIPTTTNAVHICATEQASG